MQPTEPPAHPSDALPPHQFWRSIAGVEPHLVDPVTRPRFTIGREARVATAGSCFAQHIARSIARAGFADLVTEPGPDQAQEGSTYGIFSARYGNIYTTVQLLQLFEEAFGQRTVAVEPWLRPDGRYIDPLRQQVEPRGFATAQDVRQDRVRHLECVRRMFREADIFVFTLGLTEAWRLRADGTVLSSAPGVVGGRFDPALHEFVNFTVAQSYAALTTFLDRFHALNPAAKVLLTVSPVPLMATYEDRSVLSATVYSKSVLRVVAEQAVQAFDWVDYFPSYEIITGSFSGGMYYHSNHRDVNSLGVAHAIRSFMTNYTETRVTGAGAYPNLAADATAAKDVICDEDILAGARG